MEEVSKNWTDWLKRTRFSYMDENQINQTLNWLIDIRDELINLADIKKGQIVADFGCGAGLLAFGVMEKFKDDVEIIFSDKFEDCLEECRAILQDINTTYKVSFVQSDISNIQLPDLYIDRAMTRSVLVHVKEKQPVFNELYRVLKKGGYYCGFEPIISENTRYYELILPNQATDYFEFKKAEKEFMENKDDPLVNFNQKTLEENAKQAGFENVNIDVKYVRSKYLAKKEAIKAWFYAPPAPDQKSMKARFLDYFDEEKTDKFIQEVQNALDNKMVTITSKTALIKAEK